jgi:hypothetical protein
VNSIYIIIIIIHHSPFTTFFINTTICSFPDPHARSPQTHRSPKQSITTLDTHQPSDSIHNPPNSPNPAQQPKTSQNVSHQHAPKSNRRSPFPQIISQVGEIGKK